MAASRVLSEASIGTLARLLTDRGLTDPEIERGLDYAVASAARTLRHGFTLAMSRILYSDVQLAEGRRFDFPDAS